MDALSANIASNVKRFREQLGLSQQQVANVAQVPRPTWANLESGQANPTIAVLTKVASALNVSVEELLRPPLASARVVPAEALPSKRRGRVAVRSLLPETVAGLEIERLALPPKAQINMPPHSVGSRKYSTCELGEVEVTVGGTRYDNRAGDVVVFRGDQPHAYRNTGRAAAVVYCIVSFAGTD